MGVVFETPVLMAYKRQFLTRIYWFLITFKDDTRNDADPLYPVHIKIRVHLSKENILTWLLSESRLKDKSGAHYFRELPCWRVQPMAAVFVSRHLCSWTE
jgi:hypothetical protein